MKLSFKIAFFSGLMMAAIATVPVAVSALASESSAKGYFGGDTSSHFSSGGNDNWCNMYPATCGGDSSGRIGNDTTFAKLEADIEDLLNNGNTQQQISAAFTIESMIDQGSGSTKSGATAIKNAKADVATWENDLNDNPDLGIMKATPDFAINTAYASDINDVVSFAEGDTSPSIVIYNKKADPSGALKCNAKKKFSNGTFCSSYANVYYSIKINCGNPVGPRIAIPNIDWKLSAKSLVNNKASVSVAPGTKLTFTHTVSNSGPSTAVNIGEYVSYVINSGKATTLDDHTTADGKKPISSITKATPYTDTETVTVPSSAKNGDTYCQAIHAGQPTGPGTSGNVVSTAACATVSVKPPPKTPPPTACPGYPNYASISVTLPKSGVPTNSAGPPTASASSPATFTQYKYAATGTTYTGVTDISPGTDRSTVPSLTSSAMANPITLTYASYVARYPYDENQASVQYTVQYTQTKVTYTKHTTAHTTTTTVKGKKVTTTTYTYSYSASSGTPAKKNTTTQNASALKMPPCWDRAFVVTWYPSTPTSGSLDDSEDPTSATYNSSVQVQFTAPKGGPSPKSLRVSSRVSLTENFDAEDPAHDCTNDGSTFIVTASALTIPATGTASLTTTCQVTSPPLAAGDRACEDDTVSPADGTVHLSNSSPIDGEDEIDATQCSDPLTDKPYAQFFGGDVSAGGAFATSYNGTCSGAGTPGSILAFVKGSGALSRGSGSQFAALSNGPISGFASASLRSSLPTASNGLTFSNTNANLGNLGATNCLPDFYDTMPNGTGNGAPGTTLHSGFYKATGNTTVSVNPIADDTSTAIYVNGNVYISKDIEFDNDSWDDTTDIPSFYLIATGNIYISKDVDELDGTYVSQGGTINTCTNGFSKYTSSQLFDNCQNQLTVNGSFIANNVTLSRTYSSLRNSIGGEYPTNDDGDCTLGDTGDSIRTDNTYDCGAEVFNLTPDIYLGQPAIKPSGGPALGKFDYITSLSPVL